MDKQVQREQGGKEHEDREGRKLGQVRSGDSRDRDMEKIEELEEVSDSEGHTKPRTIYLVS